MASPVSATFLMVCLKAQMIESSTSLNCCGGMERKAGKQWAFTACRCRCRCRVEVEVEV